MEERPSVSGSSKIDQAPSGAETKAMAQGAWDKKNLLCFDGGGIRGLWSLLVVQHIMEWVALVESSRHHDHSTHPSVCSSFSPHAFPEQIARESSRFERTQSECSAVPPSKRFLPCHYFDLICGSSTGALIAVLLGRLRMTVPDCIEEYKSLGTKIFGKPRLITELRFGFIRVNKFKTSRYEDVVKDVVSRRCEKSWEKDDSGSETRFTYRDDVTRTLVTAFKSDTSSHATSSPKHSVPTGETQYLFRSYRYAPRSQRPGTAFSPPSRRDTGTTSRSAPSHAKINHLHTGEFNSGNTMDRETWEIARAATAAQHYFHAMKIGNNEYTDGALGPMNNPTKIGINEIVDWKGSSDNIGVIVSIGTSRPNSSHSRSIFSTVRKWIDRAGDTEATHTEVENYARERDIPYFRFNEPGGLDIEFDEWEPSSYTPESCPGYRTIEKITRAFNRWACSPQNAESMRRCAELLAQQRHDRTGDEAAWEAFATCTRFDCPRCSDQFRSWGAFAHHLRETEEFSEEQITKEKARPHRRWVYQNQDKHHARTKKKGS